ncbi:AP2-LIKE ETHYLENE-RESPONSIVE TRANSCRIPTION FACTOR SNZ [Salix koriyanagi]|uniref:AP2-LIKE ETHYLENE-RESPONSIVE TRANSCRIPTION FACTOR SNZ n=1 Tax=Salix koriyanagi TaxID=2511006 RepID=A0A9Q0YTT2_9ROSI|nr:AP2-LIKE ETHYLENE-RESPONSIVE TRANSCRIPTION FACTOR SNZ [Salix koriyanagi]
MNTAPPPLPDLILSLEQATLMAKQLPSTTNSTHLLQIYSSLHQAHHHLSSFLSQNHQLPSFPLQRPPQENSLSSATGAYENGDEHMQVGDDDEENSSKVLSIEKVEEMMRDCFIKNKRPKRPLSPSAVAVAEERRLHDDGCGVGIMGFDPRETKLRALDLIYQFHG